MKLMAIYPRGKGKVEIAVEHEGVGYSFHRTLAVDWSAVDACYPITDAKRNDAWTAAMAAVREKHRAECEKWALPLVEARIVADAAAKAEADAEKAEEERKAKLIAYIEEHPEDADVVSLTSKVEPVDDGKVEVK